MEEKSYNQFDVAELPISCKSAMEKMVRELEKEDAEEEAANKKEGKKNNK